MQKSFSYISTYNAQFQWTIRDFPRILEIYASTPEPKYAEAYFEDNPGFFSWELILSFNNDPQKENFSWISLSLRRRGFIKQNVFIDGEFSILNTSQEKDLHQKIAAYYDTKNFSTQFYKCWNKEKLLKQIPPNGSLTICFDFKIYGEISYDCKSVKVLPGELTKARKENEWLNNEDFTFIIKNERIPAWKNFLKTRSPVFCAMLSHDMKEKNRNEAVITDIDEKVFRKMLEFIYTDEVAQMEGLEADLLVAAEKYQLPRLKTLCEEALHRQITVENALDLLVLADLNNAQQLFQCIVRFFQRNSKDIVNQSNFEVFGKKHFNLMLMLFREIAG